MTHGLNSNSRDHLNCRVAGPRHCKRDGKVIVLLLVLLPTLCGIIGLIIDSGSLMLEGRRTQQVTDSAATAAATEVRLGNSNATAIAAAISDAKTTNGLANSTVTVNIPPSSGVFAGQANHVEVITTTPVDMNLMHILTGKKQETVRGYSIASYETSTEKAALVILDPDPEQFALGALALPVALPSLPSLVGGLEVLGLGQVKIQGSVLVNNKWGGRDENNRPAGVSAGPPYAISCTPLLNLTKLQATDIRVVGGVDSPANYGNVSAGKSSPLRANKLAVPDPYKTLVPPTVASDPVNVKANYYGGKTILTLPFVTTTLQPGVYDYINVILGKVVFEPGVYVIRSKEPLLKESLIFLAGQIQAEGVMFYITDTTTYTVTGANADSSDLETEPAAPSVPTLLPSVIVNVGLLGSTFTPLNSPGSPYDGMMFYQRRHDRRPLLFIQENLIGAGTLQGAIYAKWGHVILAGKGSYDSTIVAGTARIIALLDMQLNPTKPLKAALDVLLVH